MKKSGSVCLVGAGCGDAGLITVKGREALQSCDAVVYDDLISEDLLELLPEGAEKIYMGKRQGRHCANQEEINSTLISLASRGKNIVRLKGGDPFVFGRGGEELEALNKAGIHCRVIPGITSAVAIPEMAGIPVSCRQLSRSIHIITAHTAQGGLPEDLELLAKTHGTIVILMGLSRLELICERLISSDMSPDTPAAVISGGNSACPALVRGQLSNISSLARSAMMKAPAVIVIGAVARLQLTGDFSMPLGGVRVGVTGSRPTADKLRRLLELRGAEAVPLGNHFPRDVETNFDFHRLCGSTCWITFTSANGVKSFFRQLKMADIDLRQLFRCKFAVIGRATGDTLRDYGFTADLCPEIYTSSQLAKELSRAAKADEPIYLFRSVKASGELSEALQDSFQVEDVRIYDISYSLRDGKNTKALLNNIQYLCFSSAGAAESFFAENPSVPENISCVCIGEVTAKAIRPHFSGRLLISHSISAQGMAECIEDDAAACKKAAENGANNCKCSREAKDVG